MLNKMAWTTKGIIKSWLIGTFVFTCLEHVHHWNTDEWDLIMKRCFLIKLYILCVMETTHVAKVPYYTSFDFTKIIKTNYIRVIYEYYTYK